MKKILIILKFVFALLVTACGNSPMLKAQPKDYHVKIVNHSGVELDDVEAQMGKYVVSVGILINKGTGQHLFFNHPIPKKVTVSFIKGEFDPDKKQPTYTRTAIIKLPKEKFKTIVYTINRNLKIDVTFEKQK